MADETNIYRRIRQYYESNFSEDLTPEETTIVSFGLQAPEGTVFTVDNNTCTVGKTGIFEWDVSGFGYINNITVKHNSATGGNHGQTVILNICYETQDSQQNTGGGTGS